MKILIVTDAWHPQVNGVVRTYENLIGRLQERGHTVRVFSPRDIPLHMPMPGYREITLSLGPFGPLRRAIDTFGADHLHIATEGPLGRAARRHCARTGTPFTTCYHTQFADYVERRARKLSPRLARFLYRYTLNSLRRFHDGARAVMTATPSLDRQLREQGFSAPLHRLTRGVDFSLFHPGEQTLFADLKRPVALYAGRIAVEKSIEDFLAMDWPGSKVVVGDGPLLPALRARYPDAVFTGRQTGKALAAHYRSADIFVFPSRTDTFGLVLIEAMACGLPVAAYPATGPADIITQPFLGALDENLSLAAKRALAASGTPQERFGHAKDNYSWDIAADQFLAAM